MSDRKVLNKYYPPDYDVSKIPRLRLPSSRQVQSRIMLPMSIQCARCGEFVYKGKKFNARKEHCVGEDYLGIKRWRFYFRCPACLHEITFKTDPQHSGYEMEMGATRNYEPWKQRQDDDERQRREREEQDSDVMRRLERKSQTGKVEQDMAEVIEELRERNARGDRITLDDLVQRRSDEQREREEEEDQRTAREAFNRRQGAGGKGGEGAGVGMGKVRTRPMTVDELDFEVGEEVGEEARGRGGGDERGDGGAVEEEADREEEGDEFGRERKALSVSGLSFATHAKGVEVEERKEVAGGGLLQGLQLGVLLKKRRAATGEAEGGKKQKQGVASAAVVAAHDTPRAQAAPLSTLLSSYDDSDSD